MPVTPTLRHLVRVVHPAATPMKGLVTTRARSLGRQRSKPAHITLDHARGGSSMTKRGYRVLSNYGSLTSHTGSQEGIPGKVVRVEYDPNRSSWVALVSYINGMHGYIAAYDNIKPGTPYQSNSDTEYLGNEQSRGQLQHIPAGSLIYNIELHPGAGAAIARAAGSCAMYLGANRDETGELPKLLPVRLPSGQLRLIPGTCKVTLGKVSNPQYQYIRLGKAGRARWLGHRPVVRGVAMNSVDHPHGGESPGGYQPSVSHTGRVIIGTRTRARGNYRKVLIKK